MNEDSWLSDDSLKSWQLAIDELRKKGLREGKFQPDSERPWESNYIKSLEGE